MNVVKSASASDIDSADYVFKQSGTIDCYTLIKARYSYGLHVGKTYARATAVDFASINPGTLIIEGGHAVSTESTLNQRTITLVTIPQEVADAIVSLRKLGWGNVELTKAAVNGNYAGEYTSVIVGYASPNFNLETLLSALVNGYTIEKSAEQLAHDAIRKVYEYPSEEKYARGFNAGVGFTLDKLGIKIEGVNA